jgi:hypothetical protein
MASTTNVPGAREQAVAWIDRAGQAWMFGGNGVDSAGSVGPLNDLWVYTAGEWTWMNGSNTIGQQPSYGMLGTASTTNVPGARQGAVSMTDSAGDLWLFGGTGYDSAGPSTLSATSGSTPRASGRG